MENFIFALNATLPLFLVILLGWFLRRVGMIDEGFCTVGNRYVFQCALPVSLFRSVAEMDLYADFDLRFCVFCFVVTSVVFLGVWGLTWRFARDRSIVGAFSQAAARSSAAILGVGIAENIYGSAGMVPMMIVSAVPFFNIYSVLILSFSPQVDEGGNLLSAPDGGGDAGKERVLRSVRNILKNPIILGILIGLPFALARVTLPTVLDRTLELVGDTATPVALLVIGGSFSGAAALRRWKPAALAAFVKLFLLPGLFLPLAWALGFRESAMVAILIMLGSPTTVSAYVMARTMRGDAALTSNAVLLTTLFGSVSITLWLFLLRCAGVV